MSRFYLALSFSLVSVANIASATETFSIQLQGTLPETAPADTFILDLADTSQTTIAHYQAQGTQVICYFSAGSFEDWRDDAGAFPKALIGKPLGEWPGEYWLDIRQIAQLMPIMERRMDMAAKKGCDGIDPDNMDLQTQDTGFAISDADQITYARALAETAHRKGLRIGLKNDLEQVPELASLFDYAVNESCMCYDECDVLTAFRDQGKPVYAIQYDDGPVPRCAGAAQFDFSFSYATRDLEVPTSPCR